MGHEAPKQYPRTKADGMAEFAISFTEELGTETNLVGRARFEAPLTEELGDRREPIYLRTDADQDAETHSEAAWERLGRAGETDSSPNHEVPE